MTSIKTMPFGKHKGKKLEDVPHSYWLYLYDRNKLSGVLKEYVENTVPVLRTIKEIKKKGKTN